MNKEFIPYPEALALKELGFNKPCLTYYKNNGEFSPLPYEKEGFTSNDLDKAILVPLYQQAFRWFREKHKLQAEILWRGDMGYFCFFHCYKTDNFKYGEHTVSEKDYKTYEEAEFECLKKLIEIINLNKKI